MRVASLIPSGILLLALAGCVRRPAPSAPASACERPPRPVAAATPPPAPSPQTPCERAYAASVARLRALPPVPRQEGESGDAEASHNDTILSGESPFRFCYASPRGTWSVEVESLRRWHMQDSSDSEVGYPYAGRWALVFTAPDGRRAVAHPEPDPRGSYNSEATNIVIANGLVGMFPARFAAFDYDGDGVPEVVSVLSTIQNEAPRYSRAQVWTVQDGRVVPYAPAQGIAAVDVEDVDGDGRPDLITHLGYDQPSGGRGSGFEYNMVGPRFVAHATESGGFSIDDPAAIAAARRACPPRAGSVFVYSGGDPAQRYVLDTETAHAIVCARMRGAAPGPIVREVGRACAPRRPRAGGEPEETCDSPQLFVDFASRTPPLSVGE